MTVAASAGGAAQHGLRQHDKYNRLVAAAQAVQRLKVAVAHPCDAASLGAVFEAVELGLIEPILVGPQARIAAAAAARRRRSASCDGSSCTRWTPSRSCTP
jgi:phosphate acetyltransferase